MNMFKAILFLAFIVLCQGSEASEDVVVVVNKHAPVDEMTRSQVIDLFMGKFVAFPDGTKALPVEVKQETEIKQQFYRQLVGMSMARVNAYWARLRFTGKSRTTVPKMSESELIEYIELSDVAIGYIPREKVTPQLKVVFELNE